jgi:hypothetical protein
MVLYIVPPLSNLEFKENAMINAKNSIGKVDSAQIIRVFNTDFKNSLSLNK